MPDHSGPWPAGTRCRVDPMASDIDRTRAPSYAGAPAPQGRSDSMLSLPGGERFAVMSPAPTGG
jgi:hypothetical protein